MSKIIYRKFKPFDIEPINNEDDYLLHAEISPINIFVFIIKRIQNIYFLVDHINQGCLKLLNSF